MKRLFACWTLILILLAAGGCARYNYYYPRDYSNEYYSPNSPEYDFYNYTQKNPERNPYPYRFDFFYYSYSPPLAYYSNAYPRRDFNYYPY